MSWWMFLALVHAAEPTPEAAGEAPSDTEAAASAAPEGPSGPDRSGPPEVPPPEVLVLAEPELHAIGATQVHVVPVPGVRKVEVRVRPGIGQITLMGAPGLEGRAVGWLADAATADHDAAELSGLEDLHNLDVYSSMSLHHGTLGVEVPLEDLDVGLELLSEMVRTAAFPKAETRRWVTNQRRHYTLTGPSSLSSVAGSAVSYGWFPSDHPYGARPDLAVLDGIDGEGLAATYGRWLQEAPLEVLVVGDVSYADVAPALEAMLQGLGTDGVPEPELPVEIPGGLRVVAVDMPGQEQVGLRLRLSAPPQDDADEVAMWAGNHVFGGHFLSRLNTNLREDKGWTYGARSSYQRGAHYGMVTVDVDVAVANAAAAIAEIEAEVGRLVEQGVTEPELGLAYRSLVQSWNTTRGTASDAIDRYSDALDRREALADARARRVALAEVRGEAVAAAAANWFHDEAPRLWVVVGDREALAPQLEPLGWPIEWITPEDAILGRF